MIGRRPAESELVEGARVFYSSAKYKFGIEGEIMGAFGCDNRGCDNRGCDTGCDNGRKVWDVRLENGKTHWGTVDQFALIARAPSAFASKASSGS